MPTPAKLQVVQAYDRAPIAEIDTDDAAALEAKLAAATQRLPRSQGLAAGARTRRCAAAAWPALMETRRDHFSRLIAHEGGKPLTDAIVETTRAIDGVRNAADELRNFAGREIPMGLTPASTGRLAFTTREPIGVVAAISAFNHPLNLIVHQVAPAIAVGCPVIVKPATATPLSCIEFVSLVREAGLAEPWCQTFVTPDNALAEQLATDRRVAFLSFIGSARVGWHLHSKLAPGTRSALEHGGVAPAIVDRSADLDALIEPMVKGGYYHAGQVCVSTQRIYVHSTLMSAFVDRFVARVRALRVGDPLLPETEVGPLINPREVDRVESWVTEAAAAGAKVVAGGKRRSATIMEPTVLLEPAAGRTSVARRGIRARDLRVRLRSAGRRDRQGQFAAGRVPGERLCQRYRRCAVCRRSPRRSAVMINDHTAFRTDWMPFAGRRESGYGVGGIPFSILMPGLRTRLLLVPTSRHPTP